MSDSVPIADVARAKEAGNRTLGAALFLMLAIAGFAGAFWYVGGVDYVAGLLDGGPTVSDTVTTPGGGSKPATVTPTIAPRPPDVPDGLAKRMYIEQIESEQQIKRLASGLTTEFTIDKVQDKSASEKWVAVTARFSTAPKTMKGVMAFSKAGANWYFLWIQDLTGVASTPEGFLTTPLLTEPDEPTAEEYSEAGIKTVDEAVIDSVLVAQAANQSIVVGILDGTYTSIACGKPVAGPGTVQIPVVATGAGASVKGSITLVTKRIDGKERTFVASFKKQ
jgi:hypothetical protein